jgi:hypothetical protein
MDYLKSPRLDADEQTTPAGLRISWLPAVIAASFVHAKVRRTDHSLEKSGA